MLRFNSTTQDRNPRIQRDLGDVLLGDGNALGGASVNTIAGRSLADDDRRHSVTVLP